MTTKQRRTTSLVVLALVAAVLAVTGVSWPFWLVFGVIALGTGVELARASRA